MRYTLMRFPGFRRKAVTLSYDDGVRADKKLIGILDEYGLKCTFNLPSGFFAEDDGDEHLSEREAVELYKGSGHEVALHGLRHLSLSEVGDAMAARDIVADKVRLENLFGKIVIGMAYANGSSDRHAAEIASHCGIRYARTTVSTEKFDIPEDFMLMPVTCHHANPRLDLLTDEFISDGESSYPWGNHPKLFSLWGHSVEFERNRNWNIIEDFAKKIGNRSDIYYATNGEIYEYVEAFKQLRTSSDGKLWYNPTCTDLFVSYEGIKAKIAAGQTAEFPELVI